MEIPLGDHSGIRRANDGVIEQDFRLLELVLGRFDLRLCVAQIGLSLRDPGPGGGFLLPGRVHCLGRSQIARHGRLELVLILIRKLGFKGAAGNKVSNPVPLLLTICPVRLLALLFGLGQRDRRGCHAEVSFGRGDGGLHLVHPRLGPGDIGCVLFYLFLVFRDRDAGQNIAGVHPVADIDVLLNEEAGDFAV